jgi:excisionase family DNA binding protein
MNSSEPIKTESPASSPPPAPEEKERLAYTLIEVANMLGVDYLSVYRLIQRGKLKACRALRGKFLVSRTELLRMLNKE